MKMVLNFLKTSKFVFSYKIRQINALPEQKIVVSL